MAIGPEVAKEKFQKHLVNEANAIELILDEALIKDNEIKNQNTVEITLSREIPLYLKKIIKDKYILTGWKKVEITNSSENNEKAGLCLIKLTF